MEKKLKIKEVAKKLNLSTDTLRYYEKEQLIYPERSESGYRYYSKQDLLNLKYISVMRYADFSIKEVKFFMDLMNRPVSQECNQLTIETFEDKKKSIENKIKFYQKILYLLEHTPIGVLQPDDLHTNTAAEVNQYIEEMFHHVLLKEGRDK